MSTRLSPVTLTTDFGTADHYVAQMKGVILGIAPAAPIVDVTHEIGPQDVRRAAFLVADLAEAFPKGTVHVAVVDPGVGTERAILAVEARGQYYVAPDNGLLTLVLKQKPASVVSIENPQFRRTVVSSTFHGRDVMAPAAAHLAGGVPLAELGPPLARPPVLLEDTAPVVSEGRIDGAIAWVDRFGNLVTNVPAADLTRFVSKPLRVRASAHEWVGLMRFYAQAREGEALLLVGSSGRLEIAVNGGSAAERYGLRAGAKVVVDHLEKR